MNFQVARYRFILKEARIDPPCTLESTRTCSISILLRIEQLQYILKLRRNLEASLIHARMSRWCRMWVTSHLINQWDQLSQEEISSMYQCRLSSLNLKSRWPRLINERRALRWWIDWSIKLTWSWKKIRNIRARWRSLIKIQMLDFSHSILKYQAPRRRNSRRSRNEFIFINKTHFWTQAKAMVLPIYP